MARTARGTTRLCAAAAAVLLGAGLAGCASSRAPTASPAAEDAPTASPSAPAPTGEPADPTSPPTAAAAPEGALDVALVVELDDAQAVGEAMWELMESGWEHDLGDHPWTTALEELDGAFEAAALSLEPGQPLEVTTTPMAVAALLVSLDTEAQFFTMGGDAATAEPYRVAAEHVRAQLSAEQAAEVERCATEPMDAWVGWT